MLKKSFEIDKRYVPAFYAFSPGMPDTYLTCIQRFPNGEVLMVWSDDGKHVVISDSSFNSYIEVI